MEAGAHPAQSCLQHVLLSKDRAHHHLLVCLGGNLLTTGKTRKEPESHCGRGLAEHGHEASSRYPETLRPGQCCCKGLCPVGGDGEGGVSLNSRCDELLR